MAEVRGNDRDVARLDDSHLNQFRKAVFPGQKVDARGLAA